MLSSARHQYLPTTLGKAGLLFGIVFGTTAHSELLGRLVLSGGVGVTDKWIFADSLSPAAGLETFH